MSLLRLLVVFLAGLVSLPSPGLAKPVKLLVFAAASLREVLEDAAESYELECDCEVVFSFAGSSILARQIDAGAPASVFISANRQWVNWLEERGRLRGQGEVVASNRLVIASAAKTRDSFNILGRGKFSMGDPTGIPAGIYAKQALEKMGLWEQVNGNAVYSENVRVALSAIERGDLLSGIVYQSDLKAAPNLHAHYVFDEATHDTIGYVAAFPKQGEAQNGQEEAFVDFLKSNEARALFQSFGFIEASTGELQ